LRRRRHPPPRPGRRALPSLRGPFSPACLRFLVSSLRHGLGGWVSQVESAQLNRHSGRCRPRGRTGCLTQPLTQMTYLSGRERHRPKPTAECRQQSSDQLPETLAVEPCPHRHPKSRSTLGSFANVRSSTSVFGTFLAWGQPGHERPCETGGLRHPQLSRTIERALVATIVTAQCPR
jgi:hypothetical protein